MNEQMITWCIIAAGIALVFIFCGVSRLFSSRAGRHRSHRHVVEIGKEKEMFFIPGDDYEVYDRRR